MTTPGAGGAGGLEGVIAAHGLGADTAGRYDAAGQCHCGETFYEEGGNPSAFLLANRRVHESHAAHVAEQVRAHLAPLGDVCDDPALRLSGHGGISVTRLRAVLAATLGEALR